MTEEQKERLASAMAAQPTTISAIKKKGESGLEIVVEGGAMNVMVMSVDLLKHVGKLLKNTDKELYSMWAVRMIAALADTANDDEDEE